MQRLLVLLGSPVEHSLSPRMQTAAMEAAGLSGCYLPLRCAAEDLTGLLRGVARAGGGGNVTLPHKSRAARAVEVPTEAVLRTGACNTFWHQDGEIHGDNTDVAGVRGALAALLPGAGATGRRVLLLGAGGAARAVLLALAEEGVTAVSVRNRTVPRAHALVTEMSDRLAGLSLRVDEGPLDRAVDPAVTLVIHATSMGLADDDPAPLSPEHLPAGVPVLDLVYRSDVTRWVRTLRARGHPAEDGGEMLVRQGAAAFERWWGRPAPLEVMRRALRPVPDPEDPTP